MSKYLAVVIAFSLLVIQIVNGEGCADFGTPSQCINGDPLKCGYCYTMNQCLEGSSKGPNLFNCSSWLWQGGDSCLSNRTCNTCTIKTGCIWCETSSTCMAGDKKGPLNNVCPMWSASIIDCTCKRKTNCSDCNSLASCAWCPSEGICTFFNQRYAYPQCDTWTYGGEGACYCANQTRCDTCLDNNKCEWCLDSYKCQSSVSECVLTADSVADCECSLLTNCSSCTQNSNCGWCSKTGNCLPGNALGDDVTFIKCPEDNWYYGDCDLCTKYSYSCSKCSKGSSNVKCGWCPSTTKCSSGNNAGPSNSTCNQGWSYNNECTCYNNDYCSTCTSEYNCVWCKSNKKCLSGSDSGPLDSSQCEGDWSFNDTDCSCQSYSTCSSCLDQTSCGWCPSVGCYYNRRGSHNLKSCSWDYSMSNCDDGSSSKNSDLAAYVIVLIVGGLLFITLGIIVGIIILIRKRQSPNQYVLFQH